MAKSDGSSAPTPRGVQSLPPRPDLEHLKNQAKRRLDELRRSDPRAKLAAAQYAIASEYGFSSWRALKAQVEALNQHTDALLTAVESGDPATLDRLLDEAPALVNAAVQDRQVRELSTDTRAMRLLHIAVAADQLEAARVLINRGADLDMRNADGRTPLHDALELGRTDIERLLRQRGATVDICAAAVSGEVEVVRDWLDRDPSLAGDRSTNLSPVGWASFGGRIEVIRLLAERGVKLEAAETLWPAAQTGDAEYARQLIGLGIAMDSPIDAKQRTALHACAMMNYTDDASGVARVLLDAGADPKIPDRDGMTPAKLAIANWIRASETGAGDQRRYDRLLDVLAKFGGTDRDDDQKRNELSARAGARDGFGRLGFVAFPVADLATTRDFYETKLGARVLNTSENAIDLELGEVRIRAYIHIGEYRRQHSGLQFLVEELDAKVERWHGLGVAFNGSIREEPWGGRVITIADPDGNLFDAVDASFEHQLNDPPGQTEQLSAVTDEQLIQATQQGDLQTLRAVLDQHPEKINLTGGAWDKPLLHNAAWEGHLNIIEELIERGFDVNTRCKSDNAYAMHFAAEKGYFDIVRRLVEAGGDIHGDGDDHELGVLGWATCFSEVHEDVAAYLMDRGATLHIFSAIALSRGDDVNRMVEDDPTQLERKMSRNEHHRRPLHHAADKNRPAMVRLILDLGADATIADASGATPMSYASDPAIVEMLTEAGAAVNLLGALGAGRYDLAEKLLNNNPSRLGPDGEDTVTLHLMASRRKPEAVRWLVDHGVDVNARRELWECELTALHVSVERDDIETVKILLDAGADPTIRDSTYDSDALGWAEHFKRHEMATLIREHRQTAVT